MAAQAESVRSTLWQLNWCMLCCRQTTTALAATTAEGTGDAMPITVVRKADTLNHPLALTVLPTGVIQRTLARPHPLLLYSLDASNQPACNSFLFAAMPRHCRLATTASEAGDTTYALVSF
jgi:hypothetical protein